jgi:hypothetical protein
VGPRVGLNTAANTEIAGLCLESKASHPAILNELPQLHNQIKQMSEAKTDRSEIAIETIRE